MSIERSFYGGYKGSRGIDNGSHLASSPVSTFHVLRSMPDYPIAWNNLLIPNGWDAHIFRPWIDETQGPHPLSMIEVLCAPQTDTTPHSSALPHHSSPSNGTSASASLTRKTPGHCGARILSMVRHSWHGEPALASPHHVSALRLARLDSCSRSSSTPRPVSSLPTTCTIAVPALAHGDPAVVVLAF